jgi:RHS repeat-associated protein
MTFSAVCAKEVSWHPSRFTGKEWDSESGNDYFGARYFGSSMGRFLSPDPSQLYYANPAYPQSFNLYSYVMNNPLIFTDPDGLDCIYTSGQSSSSVTVTILRGDCKSDKDSGVFVDGTVDANSVHYYVDRGSGASSLGYNITKDDDPDYGAAGVTSLDKVAPPNTDGQLAPSIQSQFIPTVATMDKAFLRSIPVPCGVGGTGSVGFGNNRAGVDLSSDKGLRAAYSRRLVNTPFVSASYSVKGSFSSGVSDGVSLSARIPEAPLYTVNASLSGGGITSLGVGENAGIFNTQLYVKTGNALTGCSAH